MSSSIVDSSIYVGTLRHRRFSPARHAFTYPLFLAFLDIDRLPELMNISPFAAYNRWNWASYQERDHFGDPAKSLRDRVVEDAHRKGLELAEGKIFLLTHLRYLGYNFNPVSFYYCYDRAGDLQAIMAEVNNTFGETQNYWLSSDREQAAGANKKYRFQKTFHVSPFMKLGQEYEWTFTPPSDRLISQCVSHENGAAIFDSTLKLQRRDWSRSELHRSLAQCPWITLRVIAAIHWQAMRLLFKKVPIVAHPGAGHFNKSATQHMGASWRTH